MNSKFDIGKHLRDLYSYRGEPEEMHKLADLSWWALLVTIAFIVVLVISYGVWEFYVALNTQSSTTSSRSSRPILDAAQLKSTLDAFAARRDVYQSILRNPPPAGNILK